MTKIEGKKLEDALNGKEKVEISVEEEIGYHKGCLSTLINERNELVRMVQNVDTFIQAHMKRLNELGVKISGTSDKK